MGAAQTGGDLRFMRTSARVVGSVRGGESSVSQCDKITMRPEFSKSKLHHSFLSRHRPCRAHAPSLLVTTLHSFLRLEGAARQQKKFMGVGEWFDCMTGEKPVCELPAPFVCTRPYLLPLIVINISPKPAHPPKGSCPGSK